MLLRDASFVVVDVETTGLSADQHRITEIAMVRVVGGELRERFQSLVNPEQYIPPFITQHTGITNAMVFGKPKFDELLPELQRFLSATPNAVLVGHNVSFDHGFIARSFERSGETFTLHTEEESTYLLCTCRLVRRMLPKLTRKSLKHVQDHFGIKNSRQHRAMGDAEATAKVLVQFMRMAAEEFEIETVEELLKLQYAKPNYGKRRTKRQTSLRDEVRRFPERPGVYTMRGSGGEVLYVGKAKNLHDRVSSYFAESHTQGTKLAQLMRVVREITYEETGSELSALMLESRRIKEHSPRFNSLDRRYKSQAFLRLDVQHDFPRLTFSREPGQDGAEYYGPFRSRESVEALMDVLNRSFTLRECADNFPIGPDVKPCFYYDIHRCTAPCAMAVSRDEYHTEVDRLRQFLAAGEAGILAHIETLMQRAADRLDFEEAQFLKLRLIELRRVLGTGERAFASLNANDLVVLNRTAERECEVLFVRFGMLVKQMVLAPGRPPMSVASGLKGDHAESSAPLEEWFYRQLRLYYTATPATAPQAGKPEIDEMRILSRWIEQSRKRGSRVVYIDAERDAAVAKLVRDVREITGVSTAETEARTAAKKGSKKRLEPNDKTEPASPAESAAVTIPTIPARLPKLKVLKAKPVAEQAMVGLDTPTPDAATLDATTLGAATLGAATPKRERTLKLKPMKS